jgi:oxygen-independent coproporphyrinogen-3 oxidase
MGEWDEQLTIALDHGMPHLSAYCLTVEERTALHHQVKKGLVRPASDEAQGAQFDHLVRRMNHAGLVQYEISNFGREGHLAVHNSNYWKGVPYIGIGPSAHSFDGERRRWNVANNARYVDAIENGEQFWEEETLAHAQRVNERLMTGLRTIWGVDLRTLGDDVLTRERSTVDRYVSQGDLIVREDLLLLTPKGRRFADRIASDLFLAADELWPPAAPSTGAAEEDGHG